METELSHALKILIVDDTPSSLTVIGETLQSRYVVKVATSGHDALALLAGEPVDLILLDILMPEMDGYDVIRRLKADKGLQATPVIFLTSLTEEEDEKKGLELGAVDFIRKPILPELVLARVGIHLDLVVKQRLLEQQAEALQEVNRALLKSMAEVKALRGILPICCFCKRIKTSEGEWEEVGYYIHRHSEALVSHGFCPSCLRKHYPDIAEPVLARLHAQSIAVKGSGKAAIDGRPDLDDDAIDFNE